MNYEITCQLCKHLLTSPVILNCCSTSVCSDCLSNISYKKDKNNNNSSGKLYYNCPFCFKDSEETETATSNEFLTSFIQYKHMKDKTLQSVCERCEKETKYDEIIICNECNNKNLCQECSDTIHSIGRFRVHERTSLTNGVMHQLNCINDLMRCETHIKEKIEHICLKDQQFMCGLCVPAHKQNCKNSVVTIREAYKDLLHQVKLKSEKLKGSLLSLKNDNETLKKTFEKMLENCEKSKNIIQEQFNQLFQALEQKQKEIEFSLEYISVQKKMETNKEIKEIENSCLWVESLIDMTEFATSYQNSSFVPGTKYLFTRIDSLLNNLNAKKPTNSVDLNTFSSLQFIDECKAALSKISLFASPTVHHEKSKSKLPTPRVNTPIATPPRSNTPQMNKSARYENSNQSTQSPLSRSKDPIKAQRAAIRANTANKNPLNSSINRFNLTIPDKQETQVISSRIQMNTCVETAPDSPKFSNSQSFASSRCNEGGNEDDDDDIVSNYVKITKKPLRVNGGPNSTLATYLNSLGATTSTLCTEQGINLQSAFVKSAEPKHKRNNLSEVKRSKTMNESREEGNSNSNGFYDVQHLTELQKNPLIKRMFTKIAQTATTIFVAWTHPFNTANLCYQIEYGIGTKVQGVEQFRTVFKGPLHTCIISDLMPKTSYRIRVCPILIKNKENDSDDDSAGKGKKEVIGHWSDIITVTTKEPQAIDMETLGSHAKMAVKNGDKAQIEFDKSGTILATNGYTYGKVAWEVKLQQQAAHSMPDDTNAFIRIGVMSKMMKQSTVFGTMINYGLNAHSSTIYVVLDMENRSLTIQSSNSPNKEVIHNLPDGPLYPAFQNKTNKNTNFSLKLFVQFDMPVK